MISAAKDDASTKRLGYRAVDSDGHYYEPHDAFTRHIEARFRGSAVNVRVSEKDGLGRLYYGDRKAGMMKVTQTDYTGKPGSRGGVFLGIHNDEDPGGWRQTEVINAHDFPAMMQRKARVALLDDQGIEATLLFPSVGVAVEHEIHDDVDALYANLRAFNRWLEEDWGFGHDGRIFAAPMISLVRVDDAVAEAERVIRAGARVLHLKKGRSTVDRPPILAATPSGDLCRRPASQSRSTPAMRATTNCGACNGARRRARRCSTPRPSTTT